MGFVANFLLVPIVEKISKIGYVFVNIQQVKPCTFLKHSVFIIIVVVVVVWY